MGEPGMAHILRERAAGYSKLFDSDSGFFRSRMSDGNFSLYENFSNSGIYNWGGDYTEGGPWQYRFSVPWNVTGLSRLYEDAGLDLSVELEKMMTGPSTFGPYVTG